MALVKKKLVIYWVYVGLMMLTSQSAPVKSGEISGYVALEGKSFWEENLYSGQPDAVLSASVNVEYYHDSADNRQRIALTGFARGDSSDSERSHGDLREFYLWREFSHVEMYAGFRQVFWGVTETVHLVDIINQDDLVENLDGEDKLGQPMVSLLTSGTWGTVELFGLLGFRERTYPGINGRLRGPFVVDDKEATYQSTREEKRIDLALRWTKVIGDWDIGLSHFSGTSRDPALRPVLVGNDTTVLQPHYFLIEQTGTDIQVTKDAWLGKLEAVSIKEKDEARNTAFVGGFEYTLFGVSGTASDIGILMEYQFDDRRANRVSLSQNDIAVGLRWSPNDVQGTQLLTAITTDLEWGTRFISFEGSRRINNAWFLEGEIRLFSNVGNEDALYPLRNDDYFQIELRRYF